MLTTVGVVGLEGIGRTLVRGWLRCSNPEIRLVSCDFTITQDRTVAMRSAPDFLHREGVTVAVSLQDLARRCDVVVVAVRPGDAGVVFSAIRQELAEGAMVVSCVPEIGLDYVRAAVGPCPIVMRMVASAGTEVGEGVVVLAPGPGTAAESIDRVRRLFAELGIVEMLEEGSLDAAAVVVGSSIRFLALALEGVEEGAVSAGLPRATARAFVRQTVLATGLLLQSHPGSSADLKDQVSSPGGTTIAGLAVLEELGVRGAFIRAVEAAVKRDVTRETKMALPWLNSSIQDTEWDDRRGVAISNEGGAK